MLEEKKIIGRRVGFKSLWKHIAHFRKEIVFWEFIMMMINGIEKKKKKKKKNIGSLIVNRVLFGFFF